MTPEIQILCITKNDRYSPYERILNLGGIVAGERFNITLTNAISLIEAGKIKFYTLVNGHKRNIVVSVSRFGNKYLKTEADNDTPDNLLSLASCPL